MVPNRRAFGFIVSLAMLASFNLRASAAPAESGCQKAIDTFIGLPTENTLAALARLDQDTCWSVVEPSNPTLDRLNYWAERGNRWAAQYLAAHLKQLDGGNLEDALIALGQFSDHDMQRLLIFANEGLLSKHEFTDAITMLPLSLSDNPDAQLGLLSARKSKVMAVTRKDLSEQKTQALSAINGFAAEIRSAKPQSLR